MCDYSVVASRTRLAVEGEELVACRFASGSIGLTSSDELERRQSTSFWRSLFGSRTEPCAVCIPPGAKLLLWDLPQQLQMALGVGPAEMVTMVQTSFLEGHHRDGVLFRNHQQILLQRLTEGQRITVIALSSEEPFTSEAAAGAVPDGASRFVERDSVPVA